MNGFYSYCFVGITTIAFFIALESFNPTEEADSRGTLEFYAFVGGLWPLFWMAIVFVMIMRKMKRSKGRKYAVGYKSWRR